MLAQLEVDGIVALTLHTVTGTLTVSVERETGAQTANALYEALRDRRRQLKAEARQLRRAEIENVSYEARATSPTLPHPPA